MPPCNHIGAPQTEQGISRRRRFYNTRIAQRTVTQFAERTRDANCTPWTPTTRRRFKTFLYEPLDCFVVPHSI